MVRMRGRFPQATTPTTVPQRFAVHTRVANPLEGRTGQIASFDAVRGVYRLMWSDGHSEDVADALVDRFVIRDTSSTSTRADDTVDSDSESDPQQLLGHPVWTVLSSYDGAERVVKGSVSAYLPDVQRYRVLFASGYCEDWSVDVTRERTKRPRSSSAAEEGDGVQPLPKKRKTVADPVDDGAKPLNTEKFPSPSAAYTILRKVVRAILAQDTVKQLRSEKQLNLLKNDDVKPKKALKMFVEADGLRLLHRVLVIWMKKTETHAGAMLVLKILAALPGITAEAVLASEIGKTLRGLVRVSQELDHVDNALGDLASWVIRTWQQKVLPKANTFSTLALAKQRAIDAKSVLPPLFVPVARADKTLRERADRTAQLRKLMSAEEPATSKTVNGMPTDELEPFVLVNYNSLGSRDKQRPARKVIHIESLVERVHKRQEEQWEDDTDNTSASAGGNTTATGADGSASVDVGRLRFGRPQVVQYNPNVAPVRMLATARTQQKPQREGDDAMGGDDDLADDDEDTAKRTLPRPNKLTAPVKSILRLRDEVLVPTNQIVWT
ncbi:hypothetical protein PINS_up006941 [Pythium insidiosum]|nr:hypothetical protein PINS_up006941 [Pythium insidiosum]